MSSLDPFRPLFIDTHAHLDDPRLAGDLEACLERALSAGVVAVITVGTDLASSERAVKLASRFCEVYAAVGIHPHEAGSVETAHLQRLAELARKPKVVAIGETGLDFHRELAPRPVAETLFRRHLELALESDLPVIVHSRRAQARVLDLLEALPRRPRVVLHSFDASLETARRALALGCHLSFTGVLTFPNAKSLREVARQLPLERLFVETDCPYLAPQPYRGRRNEPAYVVAVAETLAELHGLHVRDIARITTLNASRFFGLGGTDAPGAVTYPIRNSLYLNLTNRCTNACSFCIRFQTDRLLGHRLKLDHEPSAEEVIAALGGERAREVLSQFEEVVFCGFGEPTVRLGVLLEVAGLLRSLRVQVRLDTNGTGNLFHGRSIVPELAHSVDEVSVSLNAASAEEYTTLCQPRFGEATFAAVLEFIREAKRRVGRVTVTAVEVPGVDVTAVGRLARGLGAEFRARPYVSARCC